MESTVTITLSEHDELRKYKNMCENMFIYHVGKFHLEMYRRIYISSEQITKDELVKSLLEENKKLSQAVEELQKKQKTWYKKIFYLWQ